MRKLALSIDWHNEDDHIPEDIVSSMLVGTVRTARYNVARDMLTLEYQNGRTVNVILHQCKSHTCDHTCMVLKQE